MKKHTLQGENRTVFGRKNKHVRAAGNVPATIYGKKTKSSSITVNADVFSKIYAETGESGLIELCVGSSTYPVLVSNVQIHPVDNRILHVEFHQVDLKEKVKTNVPLEFIGDAQAITEKIGTLLTLIDELEVEALPGDLPEKIEVDVTKLAAIDDAITVGAIKVPTTVTVLTDKDEAVIRVTSLVSKQAEAEAAKEAAEAQVAKEASVDAAAASPDATKAPDAGEAKSETPAK